MKNHIGNAKLHEISLHLSGNPVGVTKRESTRIIRIKLRTTVEPGLSQKRVWQLPALARELPGTAENQQN